MNFILVSHAVIRFLPQSNYVYTVFRKKQFFA